MGIWPFVSSAGMRNFVVQGEDMDHQVCLQLLGTLRGAEPGPGPVQGRCPDTLAHPGAPVRGCATCPGDKGTEPNLGASQPANLTLEAEAWEKFQAHGEPKAQPGSRFFPSQDCAEGG